MIAPRDYFLRDCMRRASLILWLTFRSCITSLPLFLTSCSMSTRITTVSETTSLKTDRIEIIFWTPASEVEPHIAGHTFDARIGHASFRCIPHDPGGVHLLLFDRFEVSPIP
jgi:hypothetical protein